MVVGEIRSRVVRWLRSHGGLGIVVLLVASAGVRLFAGLGLDATWIAPDEMTYGMLGRAFWQTGHLRVLDGFAPFYGLYPLVAGAPLAAFGSAAGLAVLKAIEVILVTSTVAVVYLWARSLFGRGWALAAAAMTAALPGFAYSGLIMSETAVLPAATLTLWLLFRALSVPSYGNQALVFAGLVLAVAMGFESLVLLPTLCASIGLMAWFSRDAGVLKRFWPTWSLLGGGLLLWAVVSVVGSRVAGLGAYAVAGHGYAFGSAVRWIALHAGDVLLLVGGAPLLAALILLVDAARGRERDRPTQALLSVTLAYGVLLVIEVGTFASQFANRLVERDLITIAPPLFLTFAVWLGRGMPRRQPTTALVALAVLAAASFWPAQTLATKTAVPDSFTITPLLDLLQRTSADTIRTAWIAGVAATAVLVVLTPRRARAALALVVIAALGAASVVAQRTIDTTARQARAELYGTSSTQWVDETADGPVVYLDDNRFLWNESWELAFWNQKITTVAPLSPIGGSRPDKISATPRADGRLVDQAGNPFPERLVLAGEDLTFVGVRLKTITQGPDLPGLTLWRTPAFPTLSSQMVAAQPGRQLMNPFRLTVYGCRNRVLALQVSASTAGGELAVRAANLQAAHAHLPLGKLVRIWVPPQRARGHESASCTYSLDPQGAIVLVNVATAEQHGGTPPTGVQLHRLGARVTEIAMNGVVTRSGAETAASPAAAQVSQVGYCLRGTFLALPVNQPRTDPQLKGAVPANLIAGEGTTCSPPPAGYVRDGFAPAGPGVPPGFYPYYRAP